MLMLRPRAGFEPGLSPGQTRVSQFLRWRSFCALLNLLLAWGVRMKTLLTATSFAFVVVLASPAIGQGVVLPGCNSPTKLAKGPKRTLLVCLDGKHSTCLRDSQRIGNSYAVAKGYCDSLKAQGRVK